jgi:hypothetical protein
LRLVVGEQQAVLAVADSVEELYRESQQLVIYKSPLLRYFLITPVLQVAFLKASADQSETVPLAVLV